MRAGERITVHGDFDVDGVCATTILVSTLRELGAECDWLIPDRMADGYGLSAENVRKLAERGTSLIVTVDCGITAVEEVALAKELGHGGRRHGPPPAWGGASGLPDPAPGLDRRAIRLTSFAGPRWRGSWRARCGGRSGTGSPKRSASSPSVLGTPSRRPLDDDLDLVALATVADLVPLVGENRTLVKRGLEEVRRARRPGMRALIAAAKCEPTQLDEGDLAFRLAPRINAAGRLYRADAGVELFLTEDEARAAEIAVELSRANGERRATEREVANEAEAALRELPEHLREAPGLVRRRARAGTRA